MSNFRFSLLRPCCDSSRCAAQRALQGSSYMHGEFAHAWLPERPRQGPVVTLLGPIFLLYKALSPLPPKKFGIRSTTFYNFVKRCLVLSPHFSPTPILLPLFQLARMIKTKITIDAPLPLSKKQKIQI